MAGRLDPGGFSGDTGRDMGRPVRAQLRPEDLALMRGQAMAQALRRRPVMRLPEMMVDPRAQAMLAQALRSRPPVQPL